MSASVNIQPAPPATTTRREQAEVFRTKILWRPFFDALQEAGLLPEPGKTREVVIRARVGEPCTITYTKFVPGEAVTDIVAALEPADKVQASVVN